MILRDILGVPANSKVNFKTLTTLTEHMLLSNVSMTAEEYKSLGPDSRKAFVKAAENLRIQSAVKVGLASKSAEAAAEIQRPMDDGFMAGQLSLNKAVEAYVRSMNG